MTKKGEKLLDTLVVPHGKKIDLRNDYDPGHTGHFMSKDEVHNAMASGIHRLSVQQEKLYAQDTYAVLIIFQAMDAAGKDSTIKHVMSGVNPQGVRVTSFKVPSVEELDHDYLWRNCIALPRRGEIGIFNRSYYEEVLVVRVHPEYLDRQRIPQKLKDENLWHRRFEEINNFEKYLTDNGIIILKFFLNVSKEEQKKRFLKRVEERDKNWKFSEADIHERAYFEDYLDAHEDMLNHTSTSYAPWYIIPADHKWFTRLTVVSIIHHALDQLHLAFPAMTRKQEEALLTAKAEMEEEDRTPGADRKRRKKGYGKKP